MAQATEEATGPPILPSLLLDSFKSLLLTHQTHSKLANKLVSCYNFICKVDLKTICGSHRSVEKISLKKESGADGDFSSAIYQLYGFGQVTLSNSQSLWFLICEMGITRTGLLWELNKMITTARHRKVLFSLFPLYWPQLWINNQSWIILYTSGPPVSSMVKIGVMTSVPTMKNYFL